MKTAAIIAEYNPFHEGHRYQIEQTRRLTGADFILVLMSGNFVQRGAPAVFNKYLRTRMALLGGADAVLELPSLYALSSAEFFASGGITLLNNLGMIDFLSFGSEEGALTQIQTCAELLASPSSGYETALTDFLKQGLSFPAARFRALWQTCAFPDRQTAERIFSAPNNILALEYCKALLVSQSSIKPVTVKRLGDSYHETALNEDSSVFCSASAIRGAVEQGLSGITGKYPARFLTCDDFSALLHYRLLMEQEKGFSDYLDCSRELSDKILKNLSSFAGFESFCSLLKSKDVTYARISRVLMHILLGIRAPASFREPFAKRRLRLPYARLLGFRRTSAPLLAAVKKHSAIPLITKLADGPALLPEGDDICGQEARSMLKQDILVSDIYESVFSRKYNREPEGGECRRSPVIL